MPIGFLVAFKFHFSLGATSLSARVPVAKSSKKLQPLLILQCEPSYGNYFAIYLSKLSSTSCGRWSEFLSIRFPYLRLFYHRWNEPPAAECFKEIVEREYLSWKFVGWKERLLSDIFVCFITSSTKRRLFWRKCIALQWKTQSIYISCWKN